MKYLKTYEQNNLDLIKCVKSGDINKIEEIIETADLDAQDSYGSTALIWSAYTHNFEITKLLIEYGADWNIEDKVTDTNYQNKSYNGKDFLDYFKGGNKTIVMNSYPDKYKEYLIKKDAGKYNL